MTRAEEFADSMWDELGLLHSGLEMTRGDWIRKMAPAITRFVNSELGALKPSGVGNYVHSHKGCPFMYCDQEPPFTACEEKCRHA